MSETEVQRAVIQHIRYRAAAGVEVLHVPNGGARSRTEAAIFKGLGTLAGAPDLLIFHDGRCYALELKREHGGRTSPAQEQVHERLRRAGVEVAVAAGLDAAIEQLQIWQLIRKGI